MKKLTFVFGSNLRGVHGAGAAYDAVRFYGAQRGIGEGMQGNSYGIPTKDWDIQTLPLEQVEKHVQKFLKFATAHPDMYFNITQIGCGFAGYTPKDIAPMFRNIPDNCFLPEEFIEELKNEKQS